MRTRCPPHRIGPNHQPWRPLLKCARQLVRGCLCLSLLLAGCVQLTAAEPTADTVDFERDIQPILAGRCLKCHGPDKAESGLQLTDLAAAIKPADSGQPGIVPHKPTESELLRRVTAEDESERMPPEGPVLTPLQVERLQKWIAAGADWPTHWAYRPLQPAIVPQVGRDVGLPRNAIDSFVLARLAQQSLTPSAPAADRIVLRRVYFDLLGLPPSAEEVAAFTADTSPDAYERVVDRLLANPHLGERWARHWMDVVHYAETHGHDQDRPREHAWPYRDYLIDAFNSDKPYARFVQEQIAGDVLFPDDPQALVATGMLATGPWDESSLRDIREDTLDREIARYLDRDDIVTTVMSTFASSTVHCARCHDHKFDPISQHEYYALQAVFAATDKANRAYDPDPLVAQQRRQWTEQLAALPTRVQQGDKSLLTAELTQQVADWEQELSRSIDRWQPVELVQVQTAAGSELHKLDDGSLLARGSRPDVETYTLQIRSAHKKVTALRLEVLTDPSLPHTGPGRQDNGNLHLNEIRIWQLTDDNAAEPQRVTIKSAAADFNQTGWSIDKAIDGNDSTAWGIYPEVSKPHQAYFEFAEPVVSAQPVVLKIELQQSHGGGHLIGRPRLSTSELPLPLHVDGKVIAPAIAAIVQTPAAQRSDQQRIELAAQFLTEQWTAKLASLPAQPLVYCGTNHFSAEGTFRPAAQPRIVNILKRGNVATPGDEAQPGALNLLLHLPGNFSLAHPTEEGERRQALAHWLTDANNSLAWRSIANRVWHYHFGQALVDTPNDFGRMGSVPTHPQLLDWLATQLRDNRGSLKDLHRQIVTSATYRQSSADRAECAQLDGSNHWLWRMNRMRLDAESVRDAVLQISGTLDNRMGGPSDRQFNQSPGVHVTPVVDYVNFNVNSPANYRRSVYRFVFRTLPDPFMEALDCPDSSQLSPKRNESLTPLQSLALLNDKSMVRYCQQLAERAIGEATAVVARPPTSAEQVDAAYRLIFARQANAAERAAVAAYVDKHGLANACRFLINSNEFMFVD